MQTLTPAAIGQAYGVEVRWLETPSGPVLEVLGRECARNAREPKTNR
jgi:hypothetical protein